jgi:serine protease Do
VQPNRVLRIPLVLAAAVVVVFAPAPARAAGDAVAGVATVATVEHTIARVSPSLVRLNVVEADYKDGKAVKNESVGSGVIISPEGHVITNHHVAGDAKRIVCVLADNEEVEATLVGSDPLSDIAVVKLAGAPGRIFPSVEFADSDLVRVGQEALAMGNPLALAKAVTHGIISNTRMVMPGTYQRRGALTMRGESVGTMVRWLVHDARIYPGNSGGPLVDLDGRVIGINEVSFGLSGAIPANLARNVADQLIEHGKVRRSWIGMEFQSLLKGSGPQPGDQPGDRPTDQQGCVVREVVEGSPASLAGVRSGDILLRLGDVDMTARFDEEIPLLNQKVAALPVGQAIEAALQRDGKPLALTLTTLERQPLQPPDAALDDWGITVRDLSFLSATDLELEKTAGVLVGSVRSAGPAGKAKPSLQRGDVIREVAGRPVASLAELEKLSETLTRERTEPLPVIVRFTRTREDLLTVVEIGKPPKERIPADARKAWLPARLQVVTRPMARELGDATLVGLRVTQVDPGGSAEKAGLLVGDVIVSLDGSPVEAVEPGDEERFVERIRQYAVASKATLAIVRGRERSDLVVELERSPKADRELKRYEDEQFEFKARDIGSLDRVREGWTTERTGVLVTEVGDGGWADLGELDAGDLVTAVDGIEIADVAALEARMKELAAAKPSRITLRVQRGIHTWYLQLETAWNSH